MTRTPRSARYAAPAALMLVAAVAAAQERPLALERIPKPVMDAVRTRFPDATVSAAATEPDANKTTYEVTIKRANQTLEVNVTPEGAITSIEKQIPPHELPAKVRMALEARHPGATYRTIDEVMKVEGGAERLAYYEIIVMKDNGSVWEVEISPDGRILEEDPEGAEDN
jgi:hypothetical protein